MAGLFFGIFSVSEFAMSLSRRRFLEGFAALSGVILVGCQASAPPAEPTALANGDGSFALDLETQPAPGTAIAFLFPDQKPGLLIQSSDGKLSALSAVCTHSGCTVEWKGEAKSPIHCPCHDSIFSATGAPQSGPAKKPLARYNVQFSGGKASIRPA